MKTKIVVALVATVILIALTYVLLKPKNVSSITPEITGKWKVDSITKSVNDSIATFFVQTKDSANASYLFNADSTLQSFAGKDSAKYAYFITDNVLHVKADSVTNKTFAITFTDENHFTAIGSDSTKFNFTKN